MEVAEEILKLERGALERWGKGDPDGYLEISAADVVYFDPFVERSIVGREALGRFYAGLRGKVRIARFEIIDPRVQVVGDVAVLTFRFDSWGGNEDALRWNATEVYRRDPEGWRIIHTHWAFTGRGLP